MSTILTQRRLPNHRLFLRGLGAIIALALLNATPPLHAADYYVSTNGTDTGNDSSAQPFRTIQKGIDAAGKPGDTVTVLPGTYLEELLLRSRGAPGKPIVIKAAKKQEVILDGAERVRGWRLLDSAHNVWAKEFGTKAPYDNDDGRWDMAPRSEQVFVDGKRCSHLKDNTAYSAMPDYSFTATLSDPPRYALKLPQGKNSRYRDDGDHCQNQSVESALR